MRELKFKLKDPTLTSDINQTLSNLLSKTNKVEKTVTVVSGVANSALSKATAQLSLEDLTDVAIKAVSNGQGLVWNGVDWVNGSVGLNLNVAGQGFFFGAGYSEVPQNTTSSAIVVTTGNEVRVQQFTLHEAYIIRQMAIDITGSHAGGTCSFGFYSLAGNNLGDCGAVSTASIGLQTVVMAAPIALPAGVYYFAQSASSSTIDVPNTVAGLVSSMLLQLNSVYTYNGIAANPAVSGLLPATLGALTATTPATFAGVSAPIWMV